MLTILLPHAILALAGSLFLLAGTFAIPRKLFGPLALLTLAGVAVCLCKTGSTPIDGKIAATLAVYQTPLTAALQFVCLAIGAVFVLQTFSTHAGEDQPTGEFYGLLLLLLDGLLLVCVANDLVMLFLSLELISIPTYVLLYIGRRHQKTQEAALKYFLLSIFSAAMLLYGMAFVYGLTGSTQLTAIRNVLTATYATHVPGAVAADPSVMGIIALVLILGGLAFKLAAVPFHFYAPDVYEGTTPFNAGVLAVVPKAAGMIALVRLVGSVAVGFEGTGQQLALILAGVTMTGGNCLALLQSNVRRMLAYSGVAHAGYMLVGVAVGFWEQAHPGWAVGGSVGRGLPSGLDASLLYLLTYAIASIGVFGALIYLGRPSRQIEHIDDLTGLVKSHPYLSVMLALFLFSMAGIPPLPGFWGKFSIFMSALSVHTPTPTGVFQLHSAFVILAVVGMLNAAIGGVYYLRLIALMFLHDPLGSPRPTGGRSALVATSFAAIAVVLFGVFPGKVFMFLQSNVHAPVAAQVAIESADETVAARQ